MPMQNRRPPSKYLPPRPHPTCGQGGGSYHIVLLEDKDKTKMNTKNIVMYIAMMQRE